MSSMSIVIGINDKNLDLIKDTLRKLKNQLNLIETIFASYCGTVIFSSKENTKNDIIASNSSEIYLRNFHPNGYPEDIVLSFIKYKIYIKKIFKNNNQNEYFLLICIIPNKLRYFKRVIIETCNKIEGLIKYNFLDKL